MRRRGFLGAMAASAAPELWSLAPLAHAQQSEKLRRLGLLSAEPPTENLPVIAPFLDELRRLGYIEGRNIMIVQRWAAAKELRLKALAAELVEDHVDVIVANA